MFLGSRRARLLARLHLALLAAFLAAAGAGAQTPPGGRETLAEVRVHGNHATPDADVVALAGLAVGQSLTAGTAGAVEARLRRSGRFAEVEVRKRYRSLTDLDQVALVIVVREHPVPEDPASPTPAVLRPFRRLAASGMLLPVLDYADGYGFTYGARVSFVHVLGRDGRVSVPLTWGATRRAAVEVDKKLGAGPIDRLFGGVGAWRRENPFYDLAERRSDGWAGASARVAGPLRAAARVGLADVHFGGLEERLASYRADFTLDTRHDPVFPRNAFYLQGSLEALRPETSARANRVGAEARGYLGVIGQAVLSARLQYTGSDAKLPAYERVLLGGAGNARGYRAGYESGDNLLAASTELRVPLTSPLGVTRAGLTVFADGAKVWDHGLKAGDAPWRNGGGVGFFFLASLFQLNADIAVREGGGVRLHLSTGLQF